MPGLAGMNYGIHPWNTSDHVNHNHLEYLRSLFARKVCPQLAILRFAESIRSTWFSAGYFPSTTCSMRSALP